MNILIEGMEMPKNCDDCFFVGRGYPDWCSLPQIPNGEDEINDTKKRPDWCPLIELSEEDPKRIYTIREDALRQFVGYLADINTSKDIAEFIGIPESLVRMLLLDLGMEAKDEDTNQS